MGKPLKFSDYTIHIFQTFKPRDAEACGVLYNYKDQTIFFKYKIIMC
jgi:hypothetical protein